MGFFLSACDSPPGESASDPPEDHYWDGVTVPLDPFRERIAVHLDAYSTAQLTAISLLPALAVTPVGGGALLLDARYRMAETYSCLDPSPFTDVVDGVDRHGRCAEGEVDLDRTHLGEGVLSVVDEPASSRISVLQSGGRVRSATTDLLVGNPFDWLRLGEGVVLSGDPPTRLATDGAGGWFGTAGLILGHWGEDGERLSELPLSESATGLVASDGFVWVATASGLVRNDGVAAEVPGVLGMAAGPGGGVWVVTADLLAFVDGEGERSSEIAVEGAVGPVAVDSRTFHAYVAVQGGVAVVAAADDIVIYNGVQPVDIAVNGSSEISVLGLDGTLRVYLDETASIEGPPLQAWLTTFIENPRQVATLVACAGSEEGMVERMDRAAANREWLDDVPARIALAVSPAAAAHAKRCAVGEELAALASGDRIATGVLFHDPPDCEDQSCLNAGVAENLALVTDLGLNPTWMSGAAGWDTRGDWVLALAGLDLPAVHAFLGLTALPEVGYDDPRAKDALPWSGESGTAPWLAASASTAGDHDPEGVLRMRPGSTLSIFNLADCPGLLQAECRIVGLGGGDTVTDDDLAVADLLLHRAAAHRAPDPDSSWYVHLPAIETFDYTETCVRTEDLWSGEACEAAKIQAWLVDVQERLVMGGVVEWAEP